MPISRTYLCDDCDNRFTRLHWERDEPVPECPYCASEKARQVPGMFSIGTNKGKAPDMVYRMAEEDYGITDMNDHLYEGDIAMKAPAPIQTAEAEAIVREIKDATGMEDVPVHLKDQVQSFWKTNTTPQAAPEANALRTQLEAQAKASAATTRESGADPMALLHNAGKEGKFGPSGMPLKIHGKSKMPTA
jgi:DNA-directed RNA polymerase subunit RPC12/RpoP